MKVLRLSDRLDVKIGDLVFKIAPMSFTQKAELSEFSEVVEGETQTNVFKASFRAIQLCLKDVEGLEDTHGEKYELEFKDESKKELTDECVEEILSIPVSTKLLNSMLQAWDAKDGEILDPVTGKKLEGVEVVTKNAPKSKKKEA